MIKVNGSDFPWEKGLTVGELLKKKEYNFHRIVLHLNGGIVEEEDYETTLINDGDDVRALHIFGGG
ncbi:MAG: sulfur carrier protein ThiS [Bacillota bacterium]|jgi:sulfur carrier protein|nr:sulfur carrier protein ThiS [Clostridia bacterium]